MIRLDENALICDLAETYGIFNYRSLPAQTVATLSIGLRENSRIKMKICGAKVPMETMILATIADYLALIWWSKTKDGQNNRNRPKSLREAILDEDKKTDSIKSYATGADFEAARARIINKEVGT